MKDDKTNGVTDGSLVSNDGASVRNGDTKNYWLFNTYGKVSSGIALGKGASVSNERGLKAYGLVMGNTDADGNRLYTSGIAIGEGSHALTAGVSLGVRNYNGSIGDVNLTDAKYGNKGNQKYNKDNVTGVGSTTVGANNYSGGTLATSIGSYSIMSTNYVNGNDSNYGQNFGSVSVGALNSIESYSSDSKYSGAASSIVGLANQVKNSNGAVVMGAGNSVTNSLGEAPSATDVTDSAAATAEAIRNAAGGKGVGGAVAVIGGGNKVDKSQGVFIAGQNNTLKNTKDSLIMGNDVSLEGIKGAISLGDKNEISGNNAVVIGNGNKVIKAGGSLALGTNASVDMSNLSFTAPATGGWNGIAIGTDTVVKDSANGIAIGASTDATNSNHSIAIGEGSSASGVSEAENSKFSGISQNNTAIGQNAGVIASTYSNSEDSTAIGANVKVLGSGKSIALGSGANITNGYQSIAIGNTSAVEEGGFNGTALGAGSIVKGGIVDSVALGSNSIAMENDVISVGSSKADVKKYNAYVDEYNATMEKRYPGETDRLLQKIDESSVNDYYRRISNVADGTDAHDAVTVGQLQAGYVAYDKNDGTVNTDSVTFAGKDGTALKNVSDIVMKVADKYGNVEDMSFQEAGLLPGTAYSDTSLAVGRDALARQKNATAVGTATDASEFGTAIGSYAYASGEGSVALGGGDFFNRTSSSGEGSIAIGYDINNSGDHAIAIGEKSYISNAGANEYDQYTSTYGVAIGGKAFVYGNDSTALGGNSKVGAIGSQVNHATALGNNTNVTAENAVALGYGSVAKEANTVSVGKEGATRRITNVDEGKADTDAATVGQLNKKADASDLAGLVAYDKNGTEVNKDSVTFGGDEKGTSLNNVGDITMKVPYQDKDNDYNTVYKERSFQKAGLMPGEVVFNDNFKEDAGNSIVKGNVVAIGGNTKSTNSSGATVLGAFGSIENSNFATALGTGTTITDSTESTAIGNNASVFHSDWSTAIGKNASVMGIYDSTTKKYVNVKENTAIGQFAGVEGANSSVALGAYSKVTQGEDNVVSVGNSWLKRKITNVAEGEADTDAATVGQLKEKADAADLAGLVAYDKNGTEVNKDSVSFGGGEKGTSLNNVGDITMKVPYQDASQQYKKVYEERSFQNSGLLPGKVTWTDAFKPGDYLPKGNVISIGHNAESIDSSNGVVVGEFSDITNSNYGVAVGPGLTVKNSADSVTLGHTNHTYDSANAVVIGSGYKDGNNVYHANEAVDSAKSVVIGYANSVKDSKQSVAMGSNVTIDKSNDSIALGNSSAVSSGNNNIALGTKANVSGGDSIAIGANAKNDKKNSVALGNGSVVTEDNQVSVGNDTIKRTITNVADGVKETDAATVGQVTKATEGVKALVGTADFSRTNYAKGSENVTQAIYDVDAQVKANAEGVVKWEKGTDKDGNEVYKPGYIANENSRLVLEKNYAGLTDGQTNILVQDGSVSTNGKLVAPSANLGTDNNVRLSVDENGLVAKYQKQNDPTDATGGTTTQQLTLDKDNGLSILSENTSPTNNNRGSQKLDFASDKGLVITENKTDNDTVTSTSTTIRGNQIYDSTNHYYTLGGYNGGMSVRSKGDDNGKYASLSVGGTNASLSVYSKTNDAGSVYVSDENAKLSLGNSSSVEATDNGVIIKAGYAESGRGDDGKYHSKGNSTTTTISKTDGTTFANEHNNSDIYSYGEISDGTTNIKGSVLTIKEGEIVKDNRTKDEGTHQAVIDSTGVVLTDSAKKDVMTSLTTTGLDTTGTVKAGGITINNSGKITGLTAGTEATDAVNKGQLDEAVKNGVAGVDASAVKYDTKTVDGKTEVDKTSVTFNPGGTATTLKNVEAGKLAVDSKEAVNGSQLYAEQDAREKADKTFTDKFKAYEDAGIVAGTNNGESSNLVLGTGAVVGSDVNNAVVVGRNADVSAKYGTALGDSAKVYGINSVAIGADSIASENNVVSVGSTGQERKIVNVAAGTADTDAVNYGQLKQVSDVASAGFTVAFAQPDGSVQTKAIKPGNTVTVTGNNDNILAKVDDKGQVNVSLNDDLKVNSIASKNGKNKVALTDNGVTVATTQGTQLDVTGDTVTASGVKLQNGTINASVKAGMLGDTQNLTFDGNGLKVGAVDGFGGNDKGSTIVKGSSVTTTDSSGNETTIDGGSVTTEILKVQPDTKNSLEFKAGGLNINVTDPNGGINAYTTNANVGKDGVSLSVDNGAGANSSAKLTKDGTVFSYSEMGATGATTTTIKGDTITTGSVTGLTNTKWDKNKIVSGRAATEDQLKDVAGSVDALGSLAVQYDSDTKDTVTFAGTNGTKLTNVADGDITANSTDAITGGQLARAGVFMGTVNGQASMAIGEEATAEGIAAVSIGQKSNATGSWATALGQGSSANFDNSTALGALATVNSKGGTALGEEAKVVENSDYAIAVGNLATATGENAVAVGYSTRPVGMDSVAVGSNMDVKGEGSVGLGSRISLDGNHSIAIGDSVYSVIGDNNTAIGSKTYIKGTNSVALGAGSRAEEDNVVSVGSQDQKRKIVNVDTGTADTDAVNKKQLTDTVKEAAEGTVKWDKVNNQYVEGQLRGVTFNGNGSLTAGGLTLDKNAVSAGESSLYIDNNQATLASGDSNVIVTKDQVKITTPGEDAISLGTKGAQFTDGKTTTTIKGDALTTGSVTAANGKIGNVTINNGVFYKNTSLTDGSLFLGGNTTDTTVVSNLGLSVNGKKYVTKDGLNANDQKVTNVATGVADTDAVNVGQLNSKVNAATYTAGDGIELRKDGDTKSINVKGWNNELGGVVQYDKDGAINGVGLENGNIAATTGTIGGVGFENGSITANKGIIGGVGFENGNIAALTGTIGNVGFQNGNIAATTATIGKVTITGDSRITGVTAGTAPTDAVNKGQLDKAVAEATNGSVKWDEGTKDTINGVQVSDGKVTANNGISAGNGNFNVDEKGNLNIGNGKFTVDAETGNTSIGGNLNVNGGLTVNGKDVATSESVDKINDKLGSGEFTNGKETYTDAINQNTADIKTNADKIATNQKNIGDVTKYEKAGINDTDGKAVTNVVDATISNKQAITAVDTKVGDGKLDSGASNLTEGINQNYKAIQDNSKAIGVLDGAVNKLDTRVDRVGAGAAALAALHPLDYDPANKWDFAAGYGHYKGANAVSIGTYYRPNETTMFSVGGSFGGGENMVNAGVSFKLGSGNSGVSTSRTAMAAEIDTLKSHNKDLEDKVAAQDKKVQELEKLVQELIKNQKADK